MKWSKDRIEALEKLVYYGYTDGAISKILSSQWNKAVTMKMVGTARARYGILKFYLEKDKDMKLYNTELQLRPADRLVICDLHSPYHDEVMMNRALQVADNMGIKECIIAGDLIDNDFIKYYPNPRIEDISTFDKEKEKTQLIFKMLDYFDRNILIKGNHENRVNRATDGKIQARHLFENIGKEVWEQKFMYSTYDKLFIGDEWMIVHPQSYSQISASVAVRLAEKYHRHVLNAHGHFFAFRYDRSGEYMAVDLGGMFDPRKFQYINEKTTTHPVWNSGFVVITKNNRIHLFHENCDWEYYGVK